MTLKRDVRPIFFIPFIAAMVTQGCPVRVVELGGFPCDDQGECVPGYVCNTDHNICGEWVSVGCDGRPGDLCPSDITTGDDCSNVFAQVPCADDAVDCDDGCRTCLDGAWSACPCTLGTVTNCAECGNDCTVLVLNATASCNTSGHPVVCDYDDPCDPGFVDANAVRDDGCECELTNSGVEICDGLDNDCDGVTDNNITLGEIFADCEADALLDTHVQNDGWACVNGACANPTCGNNYWNADNEAFNGCEYECTQSNGGDETCDDEDNDCNNVLNDMTQAELNTDCDDQTALLRVADYSCATNSCTIAMCDSGWVGSTCEDACAPTTPGTEVCDGQDNDCDGGVDNIVPGSDPSCIDFYYDEDNDTYGKDSDVLCYCVATDFYRATQAGDCDDTDAAEKPGVTWYPDADGDLYGDDSSPGNACERAAASDVTDNTDCDDDTLACGSGCYPTNPAPDLCDTYDQDCDTFVGEDGMGSQQACPAASCLDILTADPMAPDGSYWIGSSSAAATELNCDMGGGGWTTVSFEDFESGTATGWSDNTVDTSSNCVAVFSRILGGYCNFGQGFVASKTYDLLGIPHTEAQVYLVYLVFDSWDGERAQVRVDGTLIFNLNFQHNAASGNVCASGFKDHGAQNVSGTVPHSTGNLLLEATAVLNTLPCDESFGIDDVRVMVR